MSPPISEADAAARLRWSLPQLRSFESGRSRVTAARADALYRVTGAVADFWQGLQDDYDRKRTNAARSSCR
jgi:plasmid maintenance system antidote protein VapI